MNTKVLHTLEYDKIIQLLIDKATSAPGRELCRRLIPSTDLSAIEEAQQETADALSMLLTKGSTSFGGNKDLQFAIKSLEIGSALSIPELLGIAVFSRIPPASNPMDAKPARRMPIPR